MKRLILLLSLLLPIKAQLLQAIVSGGGSPPPACGSTYAHCRTITLDHTKVGTVDSANFPALISGTYTYLKTVGNGGEIQNTVTQTGGGASISVPADFIVASDACATKVAFEWESYVATTGVVNIWFNVGTLSHTADTVYYMCYDPVAVNTWQGNVNGTWNANYALVQHLPDGSTLSLAESTSNANAPTNHGAGAGTGKVDGGASCAANYYAVKQSASINLTGANATLEAWVKFTDGSTKYVLSKGSDNYDFVVVGGGTMEALFDTTNQGAISAASPLMYNDGAWHHFVGVLAGASGIILYVDGVSVATNALSVSGLVANSTDLGICATNAGMFSFTGTVDEVRVSNTNRSASWALASYNNQNSPSTFYTLGAEL